MNRFCSCLKNGENNLLAIRYMSTNIIRKLFEEFSAYPKIDVANPIDKNEIDDDLDDEPQTISSLKIFKIKSLLRSDENDVVKDVYFERWLEALDYEIRCSTNGAPILLALNQSFHYGRNYDYFDYLIDLDKEIVVFYSGATVSFETVRKMNHIQISMLCCSTFEDEPELTKKIAQENNISEEIVTFSLNKFSDLFATETPNGITFENEDKKQEFIQNLLEKYINFLMNGEYSLEGTGLGNWLDSINNPQPVPAPVKLNDYKHEEDEFIAPAKPVYDKSSPLYMANQLLEAGKIDQKAFDLIAKQFNIEPQNTQVSQGKNFVSSYSITSFSFSSPQETLKNAIVAIGLKNFLQKHYPNDYKNLDNELKVDLNSGSIVCIRVEKSGLEAHKLVEMATSKFPSTIHSSSFFSPIDLNSDTFDNQGSSKFQKQEYNILLDYKEKMFLTLDETKAIEAKIISPKYKQVFMQNMSDPLFNLLFIKEGLKREMFPRLKFDKFPDFPLMMALSSYDKDLFDCSFHHFTVQFCNLDDKGQMDKKNFYLESLLTAEKNTKHFSNTNLLKDSEKAEMDKFMNYVKKHPLNDHITNLTSVEKQIFTTNNTQKIKL